MAIYIVLVALIGLLAIASSIALAVGLLGVGGLVRLMRCARCGHLTLTDLRSPPASCPYCQHEHLTHPFAALHRGR